jgi:hypothetical protein
MLRTTLEGVRDGANTVFTLGALPVANGLILVSHVGRLLKQVAGTPVGYEFMVANATITVGVAPVPTQRFFAYVQTSLTQSYVPTAWAGLAAPSNTTLTVATPAPANSNFLLIKNGQVLEEVVGAPDAIRYRVTGTTIELGVPLLTTDVVQIFVPALASAVLSVVPLRGPQDGLNTRYELAYVAPLNYEPDLLVTLDGLTQTRVLSAPGAGQYTMVEPGILRLGSAPNSAVRLQVLLFGLIPLSTNPYAFTCERLAQRIGIWAQRRADTTEIEEAVRHIYDEYMQMYQWTMLQIDEVFATEPVTRAGTVTVAIGSRVVVGTGTAFRATDVGKRFRLYANRASYVISAVDPIRQTLEIQPAYLG